MKKVENIFGIKKNSKALKMFKLRNVFLTTA